MMHCLVYMTFPDMEEALAAGRALARARLCAGLNIIPGATSIYWWRNEVHEKQECLLFAQVADSGLADFIACAGKAHSYQTPCIVALPLADGSRPFLDWIEQYSGKKSCA